MRTVRKSLFLLFSALVLLATAALAAGPGFRTPQQFSEHYQKHGREFG